MVGQRIYVPSRGDIAWVTFSPTAGHEQAGRRPALIISPRAYNAKTGLCLACPITNQAKGYPFETRLAGVAGVSGVILADHVRSVDWSARRTEFLCKVPSAVLSEVLAKLVSLLTND
jgi:mRNA interferase MazF